MKTVASDIAPGETRSMGTGNASAITEAARSAAIPASVPSEGPAHPKTTAAVPSRPTPARPTGTMTGSTRRVPFIRVPPFLPGGRSPDACSKSTQQGGGSFRAGRQAGETGGVRRDERGRHRRREETRELSLGADGRKAETRALPLPPDEAGTQRRGGDEGAEQRERDETGGGGTHRNSFRTGGGVCPFRHIGARFGPVYPPAGGASG